MHYWQENFTNEGHGTLHNCAFPGMTLIWGWPRHANGELLEIMQMDAGLDTGPMLLRAETAIRASAWPIPSLAPVIRTVRFATSSLR